MIQSIQRASQILSLFKRAEYLSLAEIAALTGLSKTTAYGIVRTLKEENLLEQDVKNKAYCLGLGIFELSSVYHGRLDLRSIAMPFLRRLADQTHDTVQLAVLNGRYSVYLYKITTPNFTTFAVSEGRHAPASCTSTGKAILAYIPPEQVDALFETALMETPTSYSVATLPALRKQLGEIRKRGFSIDRQELQMGLCGVSVPLFDSHGDVCGSVCISFLYEHYETIMREKVPLLKTTAEQISLKLGCPRELLPEETVFREL